jgi:hypothetical protein
MRDAAEADLSGRLAADMAAFLDPGLDLAEEALSPEEAKRYLAWCARVHGEGNLDLVPFAEFFVECDPGGLKYLRRHTAQIGLPIEAAVLMWAHTYCVLGSSKGVLYEVIAARELGIDRSQMIDVLRCAGYVAGPYALNAAGELTLPYLRSWPTSEKSSADPVWPSGWAPDPDAFSAGIDHATDNLTDLELTRIVEWHESTYGEMPASLRLAAESNRAAYKLARIRFERIACSSLPAQLFPLLLLHSAVVRDRAVEAKRALQLALSVGVEWAVLLKVAHWAAVLGGEVALERALQVFVEVEDQR